MNRHRQRRRRYPARPAPSPRGSLRKVSRSRGAACFPPFTPIYWFHCSTSHATVLQRCVTALQRSTGKTQRYSVQRAATALQRSTSKSQRYSATALQRYSVRLCHGLARPPMAWAQPTHTIPVLLSHTGGLRPPGLPPCAWFGMC